MVDVKTSRQAVGAKMAAVDLFHDIIRDDCAWLVMPLWKPDRRKNRQWVDQVAPGPLVLTEILDEAGVKVGLCTPEEPHPSVVLVSFTSEHDVLAFYRAVRNLPHWQREKRTFSVVAGGYGMVNPHIVRDYVDYAYYGRAEDEIVQVINDAGEGRPSSSASVLHLPDIHPVSVRQAGELYKGTIYEEQFQGCPLKCSFCHYTFARKHTGGDHAYNLSGGTGGDYVQSGGHDGRGGSSWSLEVTWPQLMDWPHPWYPVVTVVGLDGPSERLRWLYGKKITFEEITEGLQRYFDGAMQIDRGGCQIKLYDILGFPGETYADRAELATSLEGLEVTPGKYGSIAVHGTPFRAMSWTPLAWEAFSMQDWRAALVNKTIVRYGPPLKDGRPGVVAYYDKFIESPASVLEAAAAARFDSEQPEDRMALEALITSRSKRVAERLSAVRQGFPDVYRRWVGPRDLEDELPAGMVSSYVKGDTLRKMAAKLRSERNVSDADPSWRRGKKSLWGTTLNAPREEIPLKYGQPVPAGC